MLAQGQSQHNSVSSLGMHPSVRALYQLIITHHLTETDFRNIDNGVDLSVWQGTQGYDPDLIKALLECNALLLSLSTTIQQEDAFVARVQQNPNLSKYFPEIELVDGYIDLERFAKQVLNRLHLVGSQNVSEQPAMAAGVGVGSTEQLADKKQPNDANETERRRIRTTQPPIQRPPLNWIRRIMQFFYDWFFAPKNDENLAKYIAQLNDIRQFYESHKDQIDEYQQARKRRDSARAQVLKYSDLKEVHDVLYQSMTRNDVTYRSSLTHASQHTLLHFVAKFGLTGLVADILELARQQYPSSPRFKLATASAHQELADDELPQAFVHDLLNASTKIWNFRHLDQIESRPVDGVTPLMLAAMFGHADTARELLDSGANVNAHTSRVQWGYGADGIEYHGNYDAIYFALSDYQSLNRPLVECLMEHQANPFRNIIYRGTSSDTAISYAQNIDTRRSVHVALAKMYQRKASYETLVEIIREIPEFSQLFGNNIDESVQQMLSPECDVILLLKQRLVSSLPNQAQYNLDSQAQALSIQLQDDFSSRFKAQFKNEVVEQRKRMGGLEFYDFIKTLLMLGYTASNDAVVNQIMVSSYFLMAVNVQTEAVVNNLASAHGVTPPPVPVTVSI